MYRPDEEETLSMSANVELCLDWTGRRGRRISLAKGLCSRVDTIAGLRCPREGRLAELRESSAAASIANSWENQRSNRSSARIDMRKGSVSRTTVTRNYSTAFSIGILHHSWLTPRESIVRSRMLGIDNIAWVWMESDRSKCNVEERRAVAFDRSVANSSKEWSRKRLVHWNEPSIRRRNRAWRRRVDRIVDRRERVTDWREISFPNTEQERRRSLDWSYRWWLPNRHGTVSTGISIPTERSDTYWSNREGN